ncbi:MAG: hypothetical protein RJA59_146 [Pseudomonadota bacterium]
MTRRSSLATIAALACLAACAPSGGTPVAPSGADPGYVLHALPGWSPVAGITLGRHVYLRADQRTPFTLGHELVHVRQQADAPARFWWTYLTSPRARLRFEAEAYAVHARAGCPVDGDHGLAAYLSGPAYLWTGSRAEAREAILSFR